MSTNLYWAPAEPNTSSAFGHPIKGVIAKRYLGHDGSLGSDPVSLDSPSDIAFLHGVVAVGSETVRGQAQELLDAIEKYGAIVVWTGE